MALVLVAEDSATQARDLASTLHQAGFDVDLAPNGARAFDRARRGDVDVLVTDVMMPEVGGFELCRKIRQDEATSGLPVVLLTTLDDPTSVLKGIEVGADTYVTKPYEPQDLVDRIQTLLARGESPERTMEATARVSFLGRTINLSFDGTQMLQYFLSSFEDYVRARAREDAERRTNESLRSALHFVESSFDALSIQVAILDEQGRILAANAAWKRFSELYGLEERGWTIGASYLTQLATVVSADSGEAEQLANGIRAVIAQELDSFNLAYARCDTTDERWCTVHVSRFELGGQMRVVIAHEDVTEQTRAKRRQTAQFRVTRALAEAESLEAAAPELVCAIGQGTGWDIAELWLEHGDRLEREHAWNADDDVPRRFVELSSGRTFGRGEGVPGDVWVKGEVCWIEHVQEDRRFVRAPLARDLQIRSAVAVPVRGTSGTQGVLLFFSRRRQPHDRALVDVLDDVADQVRQFSARRDAERELERRAEELERAEGAQREHAVLLRGVLDSVADSIVVANERGQLTYVNRAARGFIEADGGIRDMQSAWPRHFQTFHEDERTPYPDDDLPLALAIRGQSSDAVQMFVRGAGVPDGAHIVATGRPLTDARGRNRGGVLAFHDETEARNARAELQAKEEQLQRSQRLEAVGRLAGGVAHDFNNLLTAIISYSTFLQEDLDEGSTARQDAAEILASARRASNLTRQLLSFSRLEVVEPRVFDVRDTIQEMTKLLQRLIGEGIRLTVEVPEGTCRVHADPGQFEQVVVNLVVNARDAINGVGTIAIAVSRLEPPNDALSGTDSPYVKVSFSDTGEGMTDEVRARIFEPFFTTKGLGKGTGLGLATVYGIVRQAGGRIDVSSVIGEGSTFDVYLPLTEQLVSQRPPPPPTNVESTGGNECVLVVEDEPEIRRAARRALHGNGYQVVEAATPGEALVVFERGGDDVALVLCDIVLPTMEGPELCERIRKIRPKLPVLFTTGHASPDQLSALPEGAPVLRKPYDPRSLVARVRQALDEH